METKGTESKYRLKLFVNGMSEKSISAIKNVKDLCEQHIPDNYNLEIIDVYKDPASLKEFDIIACPTLINYSHEQSKRLITDLGDHANILFKLGIAC
ncbi:MAG: circadian clock protein KaiB [Bacteroidetes bacterium]|nr:circadian clock protein KaiB [Bacteroidota bacterium]